MAGPASTQPSPRAKRIKLISIAILAFIVLVGLTILIVWLVIRPKKLEYTIEDASVSGYDMKYNQINASFRFDLQAYNPNRKVSVFYDSMQVMVLYDDQPIAFDVVEPFFQHHRNVTHRVLRPVASSARLLASTAKDLSVERSSGAMELTLKMEAKARYKVGTWRSSKRTLKVKCSKVAVRFPNSKPFKKIECDTDG